jgi:hypothetical protein
MLPMLAGRNGIPPNPEAYQLEPKLDGQRIIATVHRGEVVLTNRRGLEATDTFPEIKGLAAAVAPHDLVLDGEVVAFNEKGQTSFQRLQRRMHVVQPAARLLADTRCPSLPSMSSGMTASCSPSVRNRSGGGSSTASGSRARRGRRPPSSTPPPKT